jgi:hypothetical protein
MTPRVRWLPALVALTVVLTLEVSPAEFAAIHGLSDRELRKRFGLPKDCDPVLMAKGGHRSKIVLVITCEEAPEALEPVF